MKKYFVNGKQISEKEAKAIEKQNKEYMNSGDWNLIAKCEHIGYAREIIDIRYAGSADDKSLLAERENTRDSNYSVLMTAEEESDDLRADLKRILSDRDWKWTSESKVNWLIDNL